MTQTIFFDVPHLYYLPQYLPVYHELVARGTNCKFVFYRSEKQALIEKLAASQQLQIHWVNSQTEALAFYLEQQPSWVIFGNSFSGADRLKGTCRTALLFHSSGTSPKNANLDPSLASIEVRFVSGPDRLDIFRERFPDVKMVVVGFAKLDPVFNANTGEKLPTLEDLGLDPQRKTILYAPTFYPSSIENMANNWPADFSAYNIIIKPHDFTFSKPQYKKQAGLLKHWQTYPNAHVTGMEDYSLLPFMALADIMVSDTSSAIFEFAALDKPVVICDFIRLRWSYRGPLKFRIRKRLDETTKIYQEIAAHASSYNDLKAIVEQHLANPDLLSEQRNLHIDGIMGKRDGKVSQRIADFLLEGTISDTGN